MRRVILADQLVAGTGAPPIQDPVLIIQGDRIEAVTSREDWRREKTDDVHVDEYPGATLLPGLIDGHVHLAFSAAETTEAVLAEYMDSDEVRLAATATENARRSLAGGVTTVRDCGGPGTMIQALRNAIEAGVTPGPRVLACGMPITTTGGHCHFFGLRADDASQVREAVRKLVQDDADWIKVMATGGRMTRNSNILRAQYTTEELREIVVESQRLGRGVAAHVLSIEGIRNAVSANVDTLEHCNWQNQEGTLEYDEDLLAAIERQGTHISITIVGFMREAYLAYLRDRDANAPSPALRRRYELESGMFARGLNAFITSDAGVPQCRFDELYLSVAIAVSWLGLDPLTAIEAVTSRAARALGIEERVGSLQPGKLADVLVVQGDPVRDVMDLRHVKGVYKDGRLVASHGAVFPSDARAVGPRPPATTRHAAAAEL